MTKLLKNDILLMSAFDISKEIKKKNIKIIEVINIFIEHIKNMNQKVNFLAYNCFEEAINIAKKYDKRLEEKFIQKKIKDLPLLFGVPIMLKESISLKNKPITYGLISRKDIKATKSNNIIRQLIANGIIILGSGNIAEGCWWIETSNQIYGTTLNPYDILRTSGGSSGGTAVAISTAACPLGIASDTGGSIRIPSYYNGVFGHKPTGGLIPGNTHNIINKELKEGDYYYSQLGPISKYSSDLKILFNLMLNTNIEETNKLKKINKIDFKKLQIICIMDSFSLNTPNEKIRITTEIETDIKNSIDNLINFFNEKGSKIIYKKYEGLASSLYIYSKFMGYDNTIDTFINKDENNIKNNLINLTTGKINLTTFSILLKNKIDIEQDNNQIEKSKIEEKYLRKIKEKLKEEMIKDIEDFDGHTIFISPTLPFTAPFHGKSYKYVMDLGMTSIFNILGFPVTQIPLGLNKYNIPIGCQIISGFFYDELTIEIAKILEKEKISYWVPPKITEL
jgi:fatty acid amide hydrolase 2